MKVSLIYVYWPNQPGGVTWCDLPWALRERGLPKRLSDAGHEVIETMLVAADLYPEELASGIKLAGEIGEQVAKASGEGELPVILCGSCSLAAIGATVGLGGGDSLGIAWFDAHPDLNTPETSTSGLFEGMALAAATGFAWPAMARTHAGLTTPGHLSRCVLFGARDIDRAEQAVIERHKLSICANSDELISQLAGVSQVYVHLDMDVHDPRQVSANAFAVPGGPSIETVREALVALETISCLTISGLDPAVEGSEQAMDVAIDHILALTA